MVDIPPEAQDPGEPPEFTQEEFWDTEHRFGESPRFIRRIREKREGTFVQIMNGDVQDIAERNGVSFGQENQKYSGSFCTEITISSGTETDKGQTYQIEELTAVYTVPQIEGRPIETGDGAFQPSPLSRPDTWSFQTQGQSIAALSYYDADTDVEKAMTNSAYSPLLGLNRDEAQTKVVIKGNRPTFPSALATALTNKINDNPWLGGARDCWKVQGISGELKYEVVNGELVRFWEVTAEILYRQTGWNLLIPDVGFNYIANGQLRRAVVWDDENKEWIASSEPVALNGSGGLALNAAPSILTRRVYKRVDFSQYFGEPPP